MTNPSGRVLLPPLLDAITAPTREVMFLARDLTAGAFVSEAPSVASLEVPEGSALSRSAIRTCRWHAGSTESVLHLISQLHPTQPGDSVHLAFLQIVAPGEHAVRAGAFATTRALRDSLIAALLAFLPEQR